MRTVTTLAALFVTLTWLASAFAMFATSGPWAVLWMLTTAVNGYLMADLWHDCYRAWAGRVDEFGMDVE